jgi:hypothetical protein
MAERTDYELNRAEFNYERDNFRDGVLLALYAVFVMGETHHVDPRAIPDWLMNGIILTDMMR